MVAALFQIIIGFTGLIGFLLRFVGPLTIAPTITLVGLSLFQASADYSGNCLHSKVGSSVLIDRQTKVSNTVTSSPG